MAGSKPAKPFISELVDNLEKEYRSPDPEVVAGKTRRFERMLNGVLLPFFGINLFLIGSIVYRGQVGHVLLPIAMFGLLALVWYLLFPNGTRRLAGLHVGGLASAMLMAALAIPYVPAAWGIGLACSVALITVVSRRVVPQGAIVIYATYLPFLVAPGLSGWERLLFELAVLLLMMGIFIPLKMHVASFASLVSATIVGALELDVRGKGDLALIVMMLMFLGAALFYEWRIETKTVSRLREFLGQAVLMFMSLLTIVVLFGADAKIWWSWASASTLIHGCFMAAKRSIDAVRVTWVAVTVAIAIQLEDSLSWPAKALAILGAAGALQIIAVMNQRRFASIVAIIIAASTSILIIPRTDDSVSIHVVVTAMSLVGFLLLSASTWPSPEPIVWWQGFLRPDHVEIVRRFSLGALGQLLRVPLFQTLFAWTRTAFIWLKYFRGDGKLLSLPNVLLTLAHTLGAGTISNQVTLLLLLVSKYNGLELLPMAFVWGLWGLGLLVIGLRREQVYYRLLGSMFLLYPWIVEIFIVRTGNELLLALLSIETGMGLWLAGATIRDAATAEGTDAARRGV